MNSSPNPEPSRQPDSPMPKPDAAWSKSKLDELFSGAEDVIVRSAFFGDGNEKEVILVYNIGLCDTLAISRIVLPELSEAYLQRGSLSRPLQQLSHSLTLTSFDRTPDSVMIEDSVYGGLLLLMFVQEGSLATIDLSDKPNRTPYESSTEISIKGPKDCFIEDVDVNIAIIRRRVRSSSLVTESFIIGRRTRTKVILLYFRDILKPDTRDQVRERLGAIDIDGLYSINQLEDLLTQNRFKILPLMDFTGRPDYVVSSLLAGRFVIIVDGNPMVLIAPSGISLIMKSPEDVHFNYSYVSFARLVRLLSLFISIFLPGIWVALMAFHQDQLPFRLMATISVSRLGLPLSSQMEMFMLLMLLEIFKEAGVRLPNPIGQTLTSIGGLIIGDAAIRAGLVSPSVVVIGAITAVSGVTLVNQSLSTVISIIRLFFFLLASIFGLYGLILGIVLLVAYMSKLQSFGVNYLAPLSPLIPKDVFNSFLRAPWYFIRRRPSSLTDSQMDGDHKKEENS